MGFSRQEYWSGLPFPSPEFFTYSISMTKTPNSGRCKDTLIKIKWKRRVFSATLFNIILRVRKEVKQGMNSKNGNCAQDKKKVLLIDNMNKPTSL